MPTLSDFPLTTTGPQPTTFNVIQYEQVSMNQMECYPTLRDRGQITIPEETRDLLGLQPGDRLKLTVEKATTEN